MRNLCGTVWAGRRKNISLVSVSAALLMALAWTLAPATEAEDAILGQARPRNAVSLDSTDSCHVRPARTPFDAGEWFQFSIQYGVIKAGDALMQVESVEEIEGRRCYHLVSKAESSGLFSMFYRVRDRIDSYLDKESFVTRRFSKNISEGNYRTAFTVNFDHARRIATYSDGTEMEFLACAQDILSAFFYVRTLNLGVGDSVQVPCHSDKKNYPLEVMVYRKETVDTPIGKFDCVVVEPILKSSGLFRQKGRLTIWLTDDEYKIPVLMKSKVAVGSISAILTGMHLENAGGKYARYSKE
ncbi:MAG: DUF3108 domain-containing protein [Candidatus Eisenbacteria bacterium]|nr:DUF3108 domain-containing protein [Candidatus Eisenbacteria bacterium]